MDKSELLFKTITGKAVNAFCMFTRVGFKSHITREKSAQVMKLLPIWLLGPHAHINLFILLLEQYTHK